MKRTCTIPITLLLFLFLISCTDKINETVMHNWPVLDIYNSGKSTNTSMLVGGIGTGAISFSGNGGFSNLEKLNHSEKELSVTRSNVIPPFFMIYVQADNTPVTKILEGPAEPDNSLLSNNENSVFTDLPRFGKASFGKSYPFGTVNLNDRKMPVDVSVKIFNPLIPCEAEVSGIPIAILIYEVTNKKSFPLEVSICGNIQNCLEIKRSKEISETQDGKAYNSSYQKKIRYVEYKEIQGLYFSSDSTATTDPLWGTFALSVAGADTLTFRTGTTFSDLNNAITDLWKDFSTDGELTSSGDINNGIPIGSLATKKVIRPGETAFFNFFLTWNFPNNIISDTGRQIRNYYAADYLSAWDVAKKIAPYIPMLEEKSILFINTLLESDIPKPLIKSGLAYLETLRSQNLIRGDSEVTYIKTDTYNDRNIGNERITEIVKEFEKNTSFLFKSLTKNVKVIGAAKENHKGGNNNPNWENILTYTGFAYSEADEIMQITSKDGTYFWSNGTSAWGSCKVVETGQKIKEVSLLVQGGKLSFKRFILKGFGIREFGPERPMVINEGESFGFSVIKNNTN